MIYRVRATLRTQTAEDFYRRLSDGSIASQRPDGAEIVASMERAVVNEDGGIEWTERCYCDPPLAHERATVLDAHFKDFLIEPVDAYEKFAGVPFMDHLRSLAASATGKPN
jgi:hypothetical protein